MIRYLVEKVYLTDPYLILFRVQIVQFIYASGTTFAIQVYGGTTVTLLLFYNTFVCLLKARNCF